MPLDVCVAGQIWLCPYPVRLAGTRFQARMTVIRLANGQVMLHSPCAMTPALAAEIAEIGPVGHIVAPGNFHTLHVASAQAAFPASKTWVCPGVETKVPGLHIDGILGDTPPADWAGEIDQVLIAGSRWMREVAMFHRPSRSLVLVDLIENFTDATPGVSRATKFWFKVVLRRWNRPGPAPEYRMGWRDRRAAAASLRRILDWPFQRILLAHGDLIEADTHAAAHSAWAEVLARG